MEKSWNCVFEFCFSVKEAAEGLNAVLMNLIDELDDNPTPAVGTPADSKVESGEGEVTSQDNLKQAQEPDKYVLSL